MHILTKHFATVYGLRNESTQRSLLGEADLILANVMDIAQGREAAKPNAKSFKNPEVIVQNVVSCTKGAETRTQCYWCGRPKHEAKNCRFREAE